MTDKTKASHVKRIAAAAARVLGPGHFSKQDAVALVAKIEQATDRVVARNLAAKGGAKHAPKLNNG